MIMAVSMVVSQVLVIFVIVHCRTMQNIVPHGATAAEALIISSAACQEGSPEGDSIHHFRLKNG